MKTVNLEELRKKVDEIGGCDAKEAYAAGKYAFVTDYVRLYALKTEGGVYMDTDVEILKPLDRFLDSK